MSTADIRILLLASIMANLYYLNMIPRYLVSSGSVHLFHFIRIYNFDSTLGCLATRKLSFVQKILDSNCPGTA